VKKERARVNRDLLRNLSIADKMGLFLVIVLGLMALMAYAYFDQEMGALQDDFFAQQVQRVEQRLEATARQALTRGDGAWRLELADAISQECAASGVVSRIHISVTGAEPLTAGTANPTDRMVSRMLPGPDGQPVPTVISLSTASFQGRMAEFRAKLFYGALLVVSLGVFLIAALIIYLLRPLLHLGESVQKIQAGDLGTRCPVERQDEVGRLAMAFNELMGNLQEKEDTMLSAYDSLNSVYQQLEAVLEALPAAVVGSDRERQVTLVNRSFLELFKLDRDDVTGEVLDDVLRRVAPGLLRQLDLAAAGTRAPRQLAEINGAAWQLEIFAAGEAGGRALMLTPLAGAPDGQDRRGFAGQLARELRPPLTVVKSTLTALKTDHLAQLPLDAQICMRMAAAQTEQLCRVTNNLLALAEREEQTAAQCEPVPPAAAVDEALRAFAEIIERKRLTVRFAGVPPATLPARREWLVLALENVLGNAAEHGPEGSEIVVRWLDNGVCVTDRGAGIPPALRQQLFEPFVERAAGEGFGVGLAATHAALKLMGWDIVVGDGEQGTGASVTMTVRR